MGQRHQIYVVALKNKKYSALGAFHHQWCYGATAATNVIRLVSAAIKAKGDKFEPYALTDERQVDVLVKSIYGVGLDGYISMVHNESEYLIEESQIRPERGDNNDGACLVIIDNDKKRIKACLFTPGHLEGEFSNECQPWRPYTPKEYLNFYYKGNGLVAYLKQNKEQAKILDTLVESIPQVEFNKIMSAAKAVK